MKKITKKEWEKTMKRAQRKLSSNKGYIRLLKDLKKEWPAMWAEHKIWNKYDCFSEDLSSMAENGVLFESKIYHPDTKRTTKYYKLGIGGFQYLYLRRINWFVILAAISAGFSLILNILSIIYFNRILF